MNEHYIIGTAGHVDHGKTSLIKALTGIDADRLKEEKERGMTVDIGFAYIDLPDVGRVGIVDVPGHERFIKNMLCGIYAMDLVLMVIDVNEGIMPQTEEHLEILRLLGIKEVCVALTKTDILREHSENYALELKEAQNQILSTFYEYDFLPPEIYPVSSLTLEGIKELKGELARRLKACSKRQADDSLFMPLDRSFTVKGIGTVVTGSLRSGVLKKGGEYALYPGQRAAQVRNLQVHGADCEAAYPGQRCAANIADYKKEEIKRGDILAAKGSLRDSYMLDVRLSISGAAPLPLKNHARISFHYASLETLCSVTLIDGQAIRAGQEGYAQLRFDTPIAVREMDPFIIRCPSPVFTMGGGIILDACPAKKKKSSVKWAENFAIKEKGTQKERLYVKIREHNPDFLTVTNPIFKDYIAYDDNRKIQLKGPLKELCDEESIILLEERFFVVSEDEARLRSFFLRIIADYNRNFPDRMGMQSGEAKMHLLGRGRNKEAGALLNYWKACGLIKETGGAVSLYDFKAKILKGDEQIREKLLKIYDEAYLTPPAYNDLKLIFYGCERFKPVFTALVKEKKLIKLDERYYISDSAYERALELLVKMDMHMTEGFTLGDYRDRLKSSRKVALSLLEYFDLKKITLKEGDIRKYANGKI